MYKIIKSFLLCFGINAEPIIKQEYHYSRKYQPEGNRFIYNNDL
jgi:hypothetical protein